MKYGNIYDRLYDSGYHVVESCTGKAFIAELCSLVSFKTVLDVGCSTGLSIDLFYARWRRAMGVDPSKKMIAYGRDKGRQCFVASATDIPFPDQFFDCVCSTDVLEHLIPTDVPKALTEMARVTSHYFASRIALNLTKGNWERKANLDLPNLHLTLWGTDRWKEELDKLGMRYVMFEERSKGANRKKSAHLYIIMEKR